MASEVVSLPVPGKFEWAAKWKLLCLLLALIGGVAFYFNLQSSPERAWASFLVGYFFWMSISMAGVFFTALQHLTGSMWSTSIRRVPESFIVYLPVSILLFFVLYLGLHHLYEWTHADIVSKDVLLRGKASYLNEKFLVIRHIALYASVLILGGWMVRNSLRQDKNGEARMTRLNAKIAAPFMIFFGWLFTFVAFDLIMSLAPHWFSTIFGIYCWSGLFYSGLGTIAIFVVVLKKQGALKGFVTENHLHDLGKLMFAFNVFWAYIGFSQFILIWYANLPEETAYYLPRFHNGWEYVSIALPLFKFVIPFFILISRKAKRTENLLLVMGVWFILGQWLDVYWMVYPTFFKSPVFGLSDAAVFVGFGSLFVLLVGTFLQRVTSVPVKDPRLMECLNHHQ